MNVGRITFGSMTTEKPAGPTIGGPNLAMVAPEELARLRRIEQAARCYFTRYCRDQAEDERLCVSGQHEDAKALRDALGER